MLEEYYSGQIYFPQVNLAGVIIGGYLPSPIAPM